MTPSIDRLLASDSLEDMILGLNLAMSYNTEYEWIEIRSALVGRLMDKGYMLYLGGGDLITEVWIHDTCIPAIEAISYTNQV